MANMAKEAMVEGLDATLPDGSLPDHQTRLQYLDRMIKMNCWSASDRMQLRNHIRQMRNDQLKHDTEIQKIKHGGDDTSFLPAASLRELR